MARTPRLSDAIQHYLREIYNLGAAGERVSTTALAREMRVSPASASAMVKKLAALHLVEHAPYRGVALTPEGERVALEVIGTTGCSSSTSRRRSASPWTTCTTRPTASSTHCPRSSRRGSTRRSASRPTTRTATRSRTRTSTGPRGHPDREPTRETLGSSPMAFKDMFSFLFQRSAGEERVAQYVIREHDRGRPLAEILEDKYVVNRLQSPSSAPGCSTGPRSSRRSAATRRKRRRLPSPRPAALALPLAGDAQARRAGLGSFREAAARTARRSTRSAAAGRDPRRLLPERGRGARARRRMDARGRFRGRGRRAATCSAGYRGGARAAGGLDGLTSTRCPRAAATTAPSASSPASRRSSGSVAEDARSRAWPSVRRNGAASAVAPAVRPATCPAHGSSSTTSRARASHRRAPRSASSPASSATSAASASSRDAPATPARRRWKAARTPWSRRRQILRIRDVATAIDGAVATVGYLEVEPGGVNVVPGRVRLVDARARTPSGSLGCSTSSASTTRAAPSRWR